MSFNSLKKTIKYRVSYSGTKETDILYKRYFINQLDKFTEKDLEDIKSIFNQFSDNEIYDFITSKVAIPLEFKEIFNKILNEE
jgi:succinate dehydrogenase flavin-adding protein (antitoxin of CptAB toxin-antitoxin module)